MERKALAPHTELGAILVGKKGISKSKATSGDLAKILIASQVHRVIPQAVYSHGEPLHKAKRDLQVVGYSTLLAKVSVEGLRLVAIFTIERKTDGHWYYNTVALCDPKEKTQEFQIDGLTSMTPVQVAPLAGLARRQRTPFERVNRLRLAFMALVRGGGGEQPLRRFALAHEQALARSRELSRGNAQGMGHSLGV